MSSNSSIEWTDATWNPVTGCTKVSPGCAHCYAETLYERFNGKGSFGTVTLHPERLDIPLRWRKPRRVFVNSMSDLFHEDVPFEFIDRVFAVMTAAPHHIYQILTKRPDRMREYMTTIPWDGEAFDLDPHDVRQRVQDASNHLPHYWPETYKDGFLATGEWPPTNVWLGTSVENQHFADIRIPELLATPAAVRFISYEPALGPVDFILTPDTHRHDCGEIRMYCGCPRLHWIIVGGESGPKARPFNLEWARSTVRQCREAGVAVFVKQLGSNPVTACSTHGVACGGHKWPWNENEAQARGKEPRPKLKSRKGGDMAEWPEDLRVREMPR